MNSTTFTDTELTDLLKRQSWTVANVDAAEVNGRGDFVTTHRGRAARFEIGRVAFVSMDDKISSPRNAYNAAKEGLARRLGQTLDANLLKSDLPLEEALGSVWCDGALVALSTDQIRSAKGCIGPGYQLIDFSHGPLPTVAVGQGNRGVRICLTHAPDTVGVYCLESSFLADVRVFMTVAPLKTEEWFCSLMFRAYARITPADRY